MKKKIISGLLFIILSSLQILFAQERVIIKLDHNQIPIEGKKSINHTYNKVLSTSSDGSSFSKIYDLQNRLLSQKKERFNEEEGYLEAITSEYDTAQHLVSSEIRNVENGSFVKLFLDNEVVVSKLSFLDGETYYFYLGNLDSAAIESEFNPMLPKPKYEKKEFTDLLVKTLRYPSQARSVKAEGTVLIEMKVDKNGQTIDYYCINPNQIHSSLSNEAIRVLKEFNPEFSPGIDKFGEPAIEYFRIPIRFKLS
jgi:TonB family protein